MATSLIISIRFRSLELGGYPLHLILMVKAFICFDQGIPSTAASDSAYLQTILLQSNPQTGVALMTIARHWLQRVCLHKMFIMGSIR